jgi:hypothetical protein
MRDKVGAEQLQQVPSLHNADRRIRLWSRGSAVGAVGQQPVSVTTGECSETVEDHDRRFWHREPLTWRSSHAFTVLNTTQFHVSGRAFQARALGATSGPHPGHE